MHRVAITGLGCISALGNTTAECWEATRECRPGIAPVEAISHEHLKFLNVGEVRGYDPLRHFEEKDFTMLDRFSQLALVAAREAVEASGLDFSVDGLGERTAVIFGNGIGGVTTLEEGYRRLFTGTAPRMHPFTIPKTMINAATSHVTMRFGITGPGFSISSACSSANHAIGTAFGMIRQGQVEVAVTGGSESTMTLGGIKAWEALRVMSPDTCRPFSNDRKGMILGEGAGVLVLETLERARARGAHIHGEIVGFGMTSDSGDIVMPSAVGCSRAIVQAMKDGGIAPEDVDYVNAHGTGTRANDPTETEAIHIAFGDHAEKLAVSSTKSLHGHVLGGAGAIEAVLTVRGMEEGIAPPTANFTEPDPRCDLDYVPNAAREMSIRHAVSNSFAFGGLNAVLAFSRFDG